MKQPVAGSLPQLPECAEGRGCLGLLLLSIGGCSPNLPPPRIGPQRTSRLTLSQLPHRLHDGARDPKINEVLALRITAAVLLLVHLPTTLHRD